MVTDLNISVYIIYITLPTNLNVYFLGLQYMRKYKLNIGFDLFSPFLLRIKITICGRFYGDTEVITVRYFKVSEV